VQQPTLDEVFLSITGRPTDPEQAAEEEGVLV
jgi:hypothetical protein